jgi:polyisoprenoid-binding protein YceI
VIRLALLIVLSVSAAAQERSIDAAQSRLTVYAYKSGLFSFAAHDHEIAAPIATGSIRETGDLGVNFVVKTTEMKVLDAKASDKDRAEIQKQMLSDTVLDASRYPEIRFVSTEVVPDGADRWRVTGDLSLHGVIKPMIVQVRRENGRYVGEAKLSQRDFGIEPISIAGGTVKVKDEVTIVFSIVAH